MVLMPILPLCASKLIQCCLLNWGRMQRREFDLALGSAAVATPLVGIILWGFALRICCAWLISSHIPMSPDTNL